MIPCIVNISLQDVVICKQTLCAHDTWMIRKCFVYNCLLTINQSAGIHLVVLLDTIFIWRNGFSPSYWFPHHSACSEIVSPWEARVKWNSPASLPRNLIYFHKLMQKVSANFCFCQSCYFVLQINMLCLIRKSWVVIWLHSDEYSLRLLPFPNILRWNYKINARQSDSSKCPHFTKMLLFCVIYWVF